MNLSNTFRLLGFAITLVLTSCKKHVNNPGDELSKLPAATQTGASTFGCLVNGTAFVPKNRNLINGPVLQCNYGRYGHGYIFSINGGVDSDGGNASDVVVQTDSLNISEGAILPLTKYYTAGLASGSYLVNQLAYRTDSNTPGQLVITRLDTINQIVSGRFSFDAKNGNNETVHVTYGRFDVHYHH